MEAIQIYTIGFTKKRAEDFFKKLKGAGVERIVDVRLNNVSQLAGFAKKDDLAFFLDAICDIDYVHLPILAPTQEILDRYKKHKGSWQSYESTFLQLIQERNIEEILSRDLLTNGCLLCSEHKPDHCHRRLVAEYLSKKWGGVKIDHLM